MAWPRGQQVGRGEPDLSTKKESVAPFSLPPLPPSVWDNEFVTYANRR